MIRLRWKRDLLLTLVPMAGFSILFYFRHFHLTAFECVERPCLSENVFFLDRWVLNSVGDLWAQRWSNLTQNMSAVYALSFLMFFHLGAGRFFKNWWEDFLLLTQAAVWNLFINETIRITTQRARPYVYLDQGLASDPSAYTSFYSGHTSFAAVTCTMTFLVLLLRGARIPLIAISGVVGLMLIVATAVLRVKGGQHFPSDVIFGAIAGMAIAVAIAILHYPYSNRANFSPASPRG